MPPVEYHQCLDAAQKYKHEHIQCERYVSLWEHTLTDPVAYYTLWLTGFTAALAIVGIAQWFLISRQISLARDAFEAEHRPWMAIRGCEVPSAITVDETGATIRFKIHLENTGATPAMSFFMFGGCHPQFAEHDIPVEMENLIRRVTGGSDWPAEVIFPAETTCHDTIFGASFGDRPGRVFTGAVVYGVFFYKSTFSEDVKHTTFVYCIDVDPSFIKKTDDGEPWPVIPHGMVKVRKYHLGWTAI